MADINLEEEIKTLKMEAAELLVSMPDIPKDISGDVSLRIIECITSATLLEIAHLEIARSSKQALDLNKRPTRTGKIKDIYNECN